MSSSANEASSALRSFTNLEVPVVIYQVDSYSSAVIGGLITSTALTLFVVPVVCTLFDDLVGWVRHGRRAPAPHREPAARPLPETVAAD